VPKPVRPFPRPARLRVGFVGFAFAVSAAAAGCVDQPRESQIGAIVVDSCSGVPDGALCNDQNTCTTLDRCMAGLCIGTRAVDGTSCTDGNQCTTLDVCSQGVCAGAAVVDGFACTDGEPCTEPDTCRAGKCTPGPARICSDGIACTLDSCEDGVGCRFMMVPGCPDGDAGGMVDAAADASIDVTIDTQPGDGATSSDSDGPDSGAADGRDATPTDVSADVGADTSIDMIGDGDAGEGGDAADTGVDTSRDADASDATDGPAADLASASFNARGGACLCGIAAAPSRGQAILAIALVALVVGRRRRRA
jgi:hypothetical protein